MGRTTETIYDTTVVAQFSNPLLKFSSPELKFDYTWSVETADQTILVFFFVMCASTLYFAFEADGWLCVCAPSVDAGCDCDQCDAVAAGYHPAHTGALYAHRISAAAFGPASIHYLART